MSSTATRLGAALVVTLLAARAAAQAPHGHPPGGAADGLGTVHFPTSCGPAAAPTFDRGVALLHSFEFGAAIRAFEAVRAADPGCAMAHWGLALARWSNPMSVGQRSPATLAAGRQAVEAAARLAAGATERERAYVAAVGRLYADHERLDQPTRVAAYERAMADLVARHPDDAEAQVFHAIAMVAVAPPGDKSYALQRRAGATLERLWAARPDHPGIPHYLIHAYDVPALAPLARAAARRYAEVAPAAAHALHMPSHTFTRLGHWEASVATNRRSMDAALRGASIAEALHAADYLAYAYLQMRRDADARAVVDGLPALAARFDETAVSGAAPGSAGVFALAAIPARYALERGAWAEAAALRPRTTTVPYADAMTYLARALGAAHLGRGEEARAAADTLGALEARLRAGGEAYWSEHVGTQRLAALAWAELAAGRRDDALAHMRTAAEREAASEKNALTPGPLAPASELLGDMLLAVDRPAEALAAYRTTLAREPRRFRALDGARRAAAAAGDASAAMAHAAELRTLTTSATP